MKHPVKKTRKTSKDQSRRYKLIVLLFSTLIVAVVVWVMIQGGSLTDFRSQAAYKKSSMCSPTWNQKEQPVACRFKPVDSIVTVDGKARRCVKNGKQKDKNDYPFCYMPNASAVSPGEAKEGQILAKIIAPEYYTYESKNLNVNLVYGYTVPDAYKLKPGEYINDLYVLYYARCTDNLTAADYNIVSGLGTKIKVEGKNVSNRMEQRIVVPINLNVDNKNGYKCAVEMTVEVDLRTKTDLRSFDRKIFYVNPITTSNPQPGQY